MRTPLYGDPCRSRHTNRRGLSANSATLETRVLIGGVIQHLSIMTGSLGRGQTPRTCGNPPMFIAGMDSVVIRDVVAIVAQRRGKNGMSHIALIPSAEGSRASLQDPENHRCHPHCCRGRCGRGLDKRSRPCTKHIRFSDIQVSYSSCRERHHRHAQAEPFENSSYRSYMVTRDRSLTPNSPLNAPDDNAISSFR